MRLGDSITLDLNNIRNLDGKLDSIYNQVQDTSYHLEQGFATDINSLNANQIYNTPIVTGYSNGVPLPNNVWIVTHTHWFGLFSGPDIGDIYITLSRFYLHFQKKRVSSYILGADGGIYSITVHDSLDCNFFQYQYYQFDHFNPADSNDYFVPTSPIKNYCVDPMYNTFRDLGLSKNDSYSYAMAYTMGELNMGTALYRTDNINDKFYKIKVLVAFVNGRKVVTLIKCK
jgi:hypothetical protein